MKNMKRLFGVLLVLSLLLALPVFAYAEGEYTYTVRIYAGAQGTIGGSSVVTYTGLHYGDRVGFDVSSVVLPENSKYYVKGIRESGKDNNTVSSPSIYVTQDVDYVVAYGIKGSSVAYTVSYQDAQGNDLLPSATFYGNVGDKPVVAYQYIDGYQPQAYNLGRTLSENAADNVFTFIYTPIAVLPQVPAEDDIITDNAGPNTDEDTVPPADQNQNQEAETPEEPQEYIDMDEPAAPLANFSGSDSKLIGEAKMLLEMPTAAKVGLGCGFAAVACCALWMLVAMLRKQKKEKAQ